MVGRVLSYRSEPDDCAKSARISGQSQEHSSFVILWGPREMPTKAENIDPDLSLPILLDSPAANPALGFTDTAKAFVRIIQTSEPRFASASSAAGVRGRRR